MGRRWLIALLALSFTAQAHEVQIDKADAWKFACSVLAVDCSSYKIPEVVFVDAGEFPCIGTLWGAFMPNFHDQVTLCSDLLYYANPVFTQGVLAHEFVHYIDSIRDPNMDGCATEWNGHRVGNAYFYSHGHKEWADFDWQEWPNYNCYRNEE